MRVCDGIVGTGKRRVGLFVFLGGGGDHLADFFWVAFVLYFLLFFLVLFVPLL